MTSNIKTVILKAVILKTVVALAATAIPAIDADAADPGITPVSEPPGYWRGPMHGETPATVAGAHVIDAKGLAALKNSQRPVMIDVANLDRKPAGTVSTLPWSPHHLSIPGAAWLPGAGSGRTDPAFDAAFAETLDALTGGDKDRPVVAFCHPKRWGSWNAAKRIAALGYRNVYWLPTGAEGWRESHGASVVQEDPNWRNRLSAAGTGPVGESKEN